MEAVEAKAKSFKARMTVQFFELWFSSSSLSVLNDNKIIASLSFCSGASGCCRCFPH